MVSPNAWPAFSTRMFASSTSPLEARLEPAHRRLDRAVVEPVHEPEREEVLRAVALARADREVLDRLAVQRGDGDLDHLEAVAQMLERVLVRLVARALERLLVERVAVDDHHAAGAQVVDVGAQRGGIERDEHVGLVGGRAHVGRGEVDLEARDACERAGGSADLGGEVGKRGEVVAGERRRFGELGAGELDSIAGVATETNRHTFDLLAGFPHCFAHHPLRRMGRSAARHVRSASPASAGDKKECIGRRVGRNPTASAGSAAVLRKNPLAPASSRLPARE